MKKAPVVIVGTVAGLAGLLSFNSTPVTLSLGSLSTVPPSSAGAAATTTSTPTTVASTTTTPATSSGGSGDTATTAATKPTTVTTVTTTTVASTVRTATGNEYNYNYGVLSVRVTASGSRITKVTIATLNDGGNFRSEGIDQQAIPVLEQEALAAQSANIQSVSGASYTSAGFKASLQSALSKLGI